MTDYGAGANVPAYDMTYSVYSGYPNPGDPAHVPGYPDGTFSFGGWSGENAYYRNNVTGQSVWAIELFGTVGIPRPDPKLIGAAIAAAATQRKSLEKQTAQVNQWYYQQQYPQQDDGTSSSAEKGTDGTDAKENAKHSHVFAASHQEDEESEDHNPRNAKKHRVDADDAETHSDVSGDARFSSASSCLTSAFTGTVRFGTVYVWDLDETLIVFNSLLTGTFMESRRTSNPLDKGLGAENARALSALAQQIEDLVYAVAERSFFFKQLEGRNRRCFGSALQGDDGRNIATYSFATDGLEGVVNEDGRNVDFGEEPPEEEVKIALRYRVVRDLYATARLSRKIVSNDSDGPVLATEKEAAQAAIEAVDALADNWLSTADEVLSSVWQFEAILDRLPYVGLTPEDKDLRFQPDTSCGTGASSMKSDVNVLVTNGEFIPTLAKLLLFGLAKHFHPTCIYSSRDCGKLSCFREVVKRFGTSTGMVAVGDSNDEEEAAEHCGMRFVKISAAKDLRSVRDLPAAKEGGK